MHGIFHCPVAGEGRKVYFVDSWAARWNDNSSKTWPTNDPLLAWLLVEVTSHWQNSDSARPSDRHVRSLVGAELDRRSNAPPAHSIDDVVAAEMEDPRDIATKLTAAGFSLDVSLDWEDLVACCFRRATLLSYSAAASAFVRSRLISIIHFVWHFNCPWILGVA